MDKPLEPRRGGMLSTQFASQICRSYGTQEAMGNIFSINISSLPNQRQMRVWHLAGLNMGQSQS